MTIEVDTQAAEILRAATLRAQARGETLGSYLSHVLPPDPVAANPATIERQRKAVESFVEGMSRLTAHLPPGYTADDSRDSIYD